MINHTNIIDVSTSEIGIQAVVVHGYWLFYERQGRTRPSPMRREAQIKWVRTRLREDDVITQDMDCTDVRTVPSETQFSFKAV